MAGQYFDAETGLHYNYHRYYDPSIGRYFRPDPIGLAGGINPFTYTNNNPVNEIDPLGLHGVMLLGRGPWYVNIPRNLRTPYKHIPRNAPKQKPLQQPRYVPKPTPDLTPKGNWLSRFLKDLSEWLSELGLGGVGGIQVDLCDEKVKPTNYNAGDPKSYFHPVYNPGGNL